MWKIYSQLYLKPRTFPLTKALCAWDFFRGVDNIAIPSKQVLFHEEAVFRMKMPSCPKRGTAPHSKSWPSSPDGNVTLSTHKRLEDSNFKIVFYTLDQPQPKE